MWAWLGGWRWSSAGHRGSQIHVQVGKRCVGGFLLFLLFSPCWQELQGFQKSREETCFYSTPSHFRDHGWRESQTSSVHQLPPSLDPWRKHVPFLLPQAHSLLSSTSLGLLPPELASSCSRDSQVYHHPWDTGRGGGGARLQGLGPVLAMTKLPELGGLKQQKSILSQCWRLGARNEGVCRAVLPPASASPSPAR